MSVTISAKNKKRCSVRLCLQLFVVGRMSCLRNVCVCLRIVMSNTYCVVFLFRLSSSCAPNVVSDCPFLLPLRYSLTFICPVSCVPYVASFSGLSFFVTPSVFSNIYLSYVLCILCCQFLWIVLFITPSVMLPVSLDCLSSLPLRYSLTCICPVSCVPNVASFS